MTEENRYPSQLAERFQIRLPDGMRDQLRAAAEASGRSMNSEIITRLEASLAGGDGGSQGDTIDRIFSNTMQRMMNGRFLPTDRQMQHLVAEYEDYKINQIHKLRSFLDLVRDVLADAQGNPRISFEEERERALENELSRLRAWANAWGYEVVKIGEEVDDEDAEISVETLPWREES